MCPVICFLIYRYVRKRLEIEENLKEGEKLKSRAYPFYRMMLGIFLGQFVCHTFFKGTVYSTLKAEIMAVFVLVGFFIVESVEALARVFGPNPHRTGPRDEDVEDDFGINPDSLERNAYANLTQLSGRNTGQGMHAISDNSYDNRKRRWILLMICLVFVFVAVVDGFFLIYRNPQDTGQVAGIVISFYINKMAQTAAICGVMAHAKIHNESAKTRLFWWIAISGIWCLMVFLSTIPVLCDATWDAVRDVVEHPALSAFFSIAAGMILWTACYFRQRKLRKIDRKETLVGILVFFLAAGQSAMTAIFL